MQYKIIVPWVLAGLLLALNIATLLSEKAHHAAYGAIESVMIALGAPVADAALRHSSVAREREALAKRVATARRIALGGRTRLVVHASETLASIPARVLPFVGSAAVVATAAYDIKSDCQSIAEMNELLANVSAAPVDTHGVCELVQKVPSASDAWAAAKRRASGALVKAMEVAERGR